MGGFCPPGHFLGGGIMSGGGDFVLHLLKRSALHNLTKVPCLHQKQGVDMRKPQYDEPSTDGVTFYLHANPEFDFTQMI